ncbi:M15 family metallopeptidase [Solibacillus daqui]|uniref:M15 family metallopeptidase n=1 Tax=Solibacillus daqui TaxID=2912187 RepID=UPI0023655AD0|nr:M15 family metallopeptidase [Solibacillus daqui]
MNSKQKKKSPIVVIVSISCVLLIAILGSVYYKYYIAQSSVLQNDAKNEQQSEETNEVDETNNVDDSESSVTELPEDNPEKKPIDSTTETEQPSTEPEVVNGYLVEQQPATEPTYVKGVLIVNKKIPLPANYNKGEDPTAVAAFEKMAAAAKAEGIELVAFSGFRSYEYQTSLYDRYVAKDGKDAADRYSARPGYSEHQSGLAFDIGEKGREDLWLTSAFGETKAGQWLVNNAHKYGFILRYPLGKEDITGFMYESWHFRYLDGDLATKVYEAGVTLEEYLGIE